MDLPKIDFSQFNQPLRVLLKGNEDTWNSLLAVVSDLTPEQLSYKHPGVSQRSIVEMVDHAIDTQYNFYTQTLVLREKNPPKLYTSLPAGAEEATQRVVDVYSKTVKLWRKLKSEDFQKEITTEWGQVLTGELALFQSITHTHYHVSEICFLRGLGGFSTSVLG